MAPLTRRDFLRRSGLGLLSFYVAGCEVELTPREARERGASLRVLTGAEAESLEALGDILLPGSSTAGIAHYVDHQLAASAAEQFLMIKYLNVHPPFAPFYRDGLAAMDAAALEAHQGVFVELESAQQRELVAQFASSDPPGWEGPPAPFFYFVVRNDALDVSYGTMEGFEKLGIPYMAHIEPPSRWGE